MTTPFDGPTREEQMEEIIRECLRRYHHLPDCQWNGYGAYPERDELPCTCWVNTAKELLGMKEDEWPPLTT